ncbi:MAG: alpha/beta hydrolase [Planctomycetaceae bacterium]|nr:alpha/beta hydrolase [Planctomycetaceae bacterium]
MALGHLHRICWVLLISVPMGIFPAQTPAQDTGATDVREVIYGHKDGLALTFDVFEPVTTPNGKAVVFIVSGGWFSRWAPPAQTRMFLAPFLAKGYRCFAVRHGSSPRYSIAEAVSDVRRAIRTIRRDAKTYDIAPDQIGVYGMSAGGHLTLMLATTGDDGDPAAKDPIDRISSRIGAGAAFVPPSDITNYVWSTPGLDDKYRQFPGLDISKEDAQAVSPLFHVTADDAPCLVISGGKDTLVLPEQGRWIHEKLDEIGVPNRFVLYEDSGHGLENHVPDAFSEAVQWFEQHLK